MFRVVISTILCFILALPWGMKVWVTTSFVFNQQEIAATQCENKDKPEMHCEGSCVLMKKLNLVEEQKEEAPLRNSEILQLELSTFLLCNHFDGLNLPNAFRDQVLNFDFKDALQRPFLSSVFHPPC